MPGTDIEQILIALGKSAANAGVEPSFTSASATDWCSASFAGRRYEIAGEATAGHALDNWLAGLPEADLPVAGHFIADIAVPSVNSAGARACFALEALSVRESAATVQSEATD